MKKCKEKDVGKNSRRIDEKESRGASQTQFIIRKEKLLLLRLLFLLTTVVWK
jgi:hypothetical protein